MTDPIRVALERLTELADEDMLCPSNPAETDWGAVADAIKAARTALAAAPEGEGPSAEQVEELCEEHCFNVEGYESIECLQGLINDALARWSRPSAPPAPLAEPEAVTEDSSAPPSPTPLMGEPNKLRAALNRIESLVEQANAAFKPLAELLDSPTTPPAPLEGEVPGDWFTVALVAQDMRSRGLAEQLAGDELLKMANNHQTRPAAPPAPLEGEVGELVAALRSTADGLESQAYPQTAALITRAADLLEQRHPAPVPVSERLPGAEDCDAEGRCWLLTVEDEYPQWRLNSVEGHYHWGGRMIWVPVNRTPGLMVDAFYVSHWLPAHALPLPQGEVE